jgi:hypothetical protein
LRPIFWKVGYDISTIEELPEHKDVSTTMIYTRPNKWYLDKDWRATDIADFLGREVSEVEGDLPPSHRGPLSGSPN